MALPQELLSQWQLKMDPSLRRPADAACFTPTLTDSNNRTDVAAILNGAAICCPQMPPAILDPVTLPRLMQFSMVPWYHRFGPQMPPVYMIRPLFVTSALLVQFWMVPFSDKEPQMLPSPVTLQVASSVRFLMVPPAN